MTAPDKQDGWLPTRRSLLSRLRNWQDHKSWEEFYDTYGRLIYRAATNAGLNRQEAEDVVQETMKVVARKMPRFKYDPALGSFKGWLRQITRRRIEKQFEDRHLGQTASPALGQERDARRTSILDRLPGTEASDFERYWEAEWEQNLWQNALSRVSSQIKPKHYQIYDLHVSKEWPVLEVARALNVSAALVYVTKHRVAMLIKREVGRLRRETESQAGG
jgi:RNA polymerase sigma-70 factor (ECF subfamily)